jgi:hypothetical protein
MNTAETLGFNQTYLSFEAMHYELLVVILLYVAAIATCRLSLRQIEAENWMADMLSVGYNYRYANFSSPKTKFGILHMIKVTNLTSRVLKSESKRITHARGYMGKQDRVSIINKFDNKAVSATLGMPRNMKKNKYLQQMIDKLPKTITTEQDVFIVDSLFKYFGTQYIRSATFGGRLNVYQYVNETDFTNWNKEVSKYQFGLMVSLKTFNISGRVTESIEKIQSFIKSEYQSKTVTEMYQEGGFNPYMVKGKCMNGNRVLWINLW